MLRIESALAAAMALVALSGCAPTVRPAAVESAAAPMPPAVAMLAPTELAAMIAAGEVALIDVRSPEEFAAGHIAGARNVPLDGFSPKAIAGEKAGKVVLYCRSGRRSQAAAELLASQTGQSALHLYGGILAWQAAGLPLSEATTAHGSD